MLPSRQAEITGGSLKGAACDDGEPRSSSCRRPAAVQFHTRGRRARRACCASDAMEMPARTALRGSAKSKPGRRPLRTKPAHAPPMSKKLSTCDRHAHTLTRARHAHAHRRTRARRACLYPAAAFCQHNDCALRRRADTRAETGALYSSSSRSEGFDQSLSSEGKRKR
eukprot:6213365-Pleurochrysis_carterae.AAC.9